MSLKPRRFKNKNDVFHLSDVVVRKDDESAFDFGTIENQFVSNNVMYIYCVPLERAIALKAFIDSFQINFSKKIDKVKKNDSFRDKIKEYASDLSYDISLNIPAYSIEESKNNLAKVTDLQKLLAPLVNAGSKTNPVGVSKLFPSKVVYFSVWFKNLISSGKYFQDYKGPVDVSVSDMLNHGFICLIDEVKYEPDLEKGFFDNSEYLYPKNIKLTLKLQYRVTLGGSPYLSNERSKLKIFTKDIPFFSYNSNGHYSRKDSGLFPFGAGTVTGGKFKENTGIDEYVSSMDQTIGGLVFTTDDLNQLDYSLEGNYDKTRIFISTNISEDKQPDSKNYLSADNTRRRYVAFKGYVDSFDRSVKMKYSTNDDKTQILGSSTVDLTKHSKIDELNFNLSFTVPSSNLIEAKKNCAKIGVLLRMSMKRADSNVAGITADQERKKLRAGNGKVKVYVPHMIENDKASNYVKTFGSMYKKSVDLVITNFAVDIDVEKGFFDDPTGKLWPKSFKVTLSFDTDTPNTLIKNYVLNNQRIPSSYVVYGESADDDPRKFPFSRQSSQAKKITLRR